jgi:hypothetical protein
MKDNKLRIETENGIRLRGYLLNTIQAIIIKKGIAAYPPRLTK